MKSLKKAIGREADAAFALSKAEGNYCAAMRERSAAEKTHSEAKGDVACLVGEMVTEKCEARDQPC